MLLLKILPILFLVSSCGPYAPKITDCISEPAKRDFRCYDAAKKRNFIATIDNLENWICLSAYDMKLEIDHCKADASGPRVTACVISSKEEMLHCFDEMNQKLLQKKWSETDGFICLSPIDEKILIDYCAKKRRGE